MRIVHVIDYFQPLLGYQETHLARTQLKRGHDVTVVTSDRYSPTLFKNGALEGILGARIKKTGRYLEEGIDVLRLPCRMEIKDSVWISGLCEAVERMRPDAVHVHEALSFSAWRLAKLKRRSGGFRLIIDEHKTPSPFNRSLVVAPVYALYRTICAPGILREADALIAVAEEVKELMADKYGFPRDRVDVIPLGCDCEAFARNKPSGDQIRDLLGVDLNTTLFAYVGKITREKGVMTLIDAALSLMVRGCDLKVMVVGGCDPTYGFELMEAVRKRGFESRFIFLPAVPNRDLSKYYSAADAGVWPKQCSMTVIEAMANGLPVIISNQSGAGERVESGVNGFHYAESDVADLVEKMLSLMDKETRERMGREARRKAEMVDWGAISTMFERLYSKG